MFTGLVEEIGTISALEPSGDGARVTIEAQVVLEDVSHGDSISVSGVCLTVIESSEATFSADVMKETINHSAAAQWAGGTKVNL